MTLGFEEIDVAFATVSFALQRMSTSYVQYRRINVVIQIAKLTTSYICNLAVAFASASVLCDYLALEWGSVHRVSKKCAHPKTYSSLLSANVATPSASLFSW
jgi:hypothetical protein